jgi:hypothetical protein
MTNTQSIIAGRIETKGNWYMDENSYYENAYLVNANNGNKELGIQHIGLFVPETTAEHAPIFNVILRLTCGITINGAIFPQKEQTGIRLDMGQVAYTKADGTQGYRQETNIPRAIQAQILRYATTRLVHVERPVEAVHAPVAPPTAPVYNQAPVYQSAPTYQPAYNQAPVAQAPVQAPVAQAPANPLAEQDMAEIERMFASQGLGF